VYSLAGKDAAAEQQGAHSEGEGDGAHLGYFWGYETRETGTGCCCLRRVVDTKLKSEEGGGRSRRGRRRWMSREKREREASNKRKPGRIRASSYDQRKRSSPFAVSVRPSNPPVGRGPGGPASRASPGRVGAKR
jgi:hypothetical protein